MKLSHRRVRLEHVDKLWTGRRVWEVREQVRSTVSLEEPLIEVGQDVQHVETEELTVTSPACLNDSVSIDISVSLLMEAEDKMALSGMDATASAVHSSSSLNK